MAYSHCTGTGPGQVQGMGLGAKGTYMLYRNVHTGLRQGKGPGSIVSCGARPVPCPLIGTGFHTTASGTKGGISESAV